MRSSHKSYRNHALLIILLVFLPVVVVGGFNYIVDPLQIYRKQQWVEPRFWSDQRSQNAGKIRSYLPDGSYDSIILGNSVADNFRPAQVAEILGWKKTMKLTVDGGEPSEQAFMLEHALETGRIRHVFWCIRVSNFHGGKIEIWNSKRAIPFFLYTKTLLDDHAYLFSLDTSIFSWELIQKKSKWESNLDRLNYWQTERNIERQIKYNRSDNLLELSKANSKDTCKPLNFSGSKDHYRCAEYNLLRLIRKYPQVEFVILIAPESRQSLSARNRKKQYVYLNFQYYLISQTINLPNTKIFGFETDDQITNNLANYRDGLHYHSGVNKYMLHAIARNNNRLTTASIDSYLKEITDKLCRFKVYSNFENMIPFAMPEESDFFKKCLIDNPQRFCAKVETNMR